MCAARAATAGIVFASQILVLIHIVGLLFVDQVVAHYQLRRPQKQEHSIYCVVQQ